MKCNICDKTLSEAETRYNKDHEEYDPCSYCLQVISEVFDDHLTEDEIDRLIEFFPDDTENSPPVNNA